MKRFAGFLLATGATVFLVALSSLVTWRLTGENELFRGALVHTADDLHVLELLESGRSEEAIEFLNRQVDTNAVLAAGAPRESWLPDQTERFAGCVLQRIKRHRERHPYTHPDAELAALVQRALAPDLRCG